MIGEVTQVTLGAYRLGLFMGRAEFARTDDEYAALREAMESGLEQMELQRLGPVPAARSDFDAWAATVLEPVNEELSARRGRLGGDTTALPVFFIAFFSFRATAAMAFREPPGDTEEIVGLALDDLGLGSDFLRNLERYAGIVAVNQADGDETVSSASVGLAANAFLGDVLTRLVEDTEADELKGLVKDISQEVRDFRAEFREQTAELARLVQAGDAEVMTAIGQVEQLLIANGMDPAAAAELTEGDPGGFWERVVRWFGGAGARDAAETALWAALEFVPGGAGVKIGIRVAQAIRASLKKSGG